MPKITAQSCSPLGPFYTDYIFLGSILLHTNNLSMKEGSLFCFDLFCNYEIHRTQMLQIMFLMSLESSRQGEMHGLGFIMFGLAMQKFLNIE